MKSCVVCCLFLSAASLIGGCAATPSAAAKSEAEPAASTQESGASAPQTFPAQVARGAELFAAKCAGCHGNSGEGSAKAPAVVGATALPLDPPSSAKFRKSRFVNVADVATFVVKNMPPNAPGSLSEEDYFSILAFDLTANGIDLGEKKLDAALAPTLVIPRH